MTERSRPLSRGEILDAALALIDAEGFKALTMRNLADHLGVVPMALYRHVANKDDLVRALLEEASGRVVLPPADLDWRRGLSALAAAIRAELLRHPGLVAPLLSSPTLGPNALAVAEYGYSVMGNDGFAAGDIERGVNAVLTYALGFAGLEVPRTQSIDGAEPPDLGALDATYGDLDPATFPFTTSLGPQAAELVSEQQFHYGLDRILDGLASRSGQPG